MRRGTDKLTERQEEILTFIIDQIGERGFPPTVAEIAEFFSFSSPNAAASHLTALKKKGYIKVQPRASRGIEVLKNPSGGELTNSLTPELPIVGRVAAGSPILAEESREGSVAMAGGAFGETADYLLRVHGDSMIDLGIYEGDLVAVRRTSEVRTGDVIVANLNDDVTVKTLRRKQGKVELEPANKRLKNIKVDTKKDSFVIEGKVVGLMRSF